MATLHRYGEGLMLTPDQFECKARKSASDPPQDCDWPFCGCDPYADKVIEAIEESGRLALPAWQPDVRKALEFCATATASVTPGYIDVQMTLAFVQAKAKEALALMPLPPPPAAEGETYDHDFGNPGNVNEMGTGNIK